MKTMKTVNRSVGAFVVATALVLGVSAFQQNKPRDPEEAFDKLRRIGAALQLYRAEYGSKPVAERLTFSDAGLPPRWSVFLLPGRPWTLSEKDFELSYAPDKGIDFTTLYWRSSLYGELGDISGYYSSRGEDLPVMADEEFNKFLPVGEYVRSSPVLRLCGTVELIRYDSRDWPGRLRK